MTITSISRAHVEPGADVAQNGASREQGQVIVPDHIPKVKVRVACSTHLQEGARWINGLLQGVTFRRTSFRRTAGRTTQNPTQSSWSGGPQRIVRLKRSGQK